MGLGLLFAVSYHYCIIVVGRVVWRVLHCERSCREMECLRERVGCVQDGVDWEDDDVGDHCGVDRIWRSERCVCQGGTGGVWKSMEKQ